MTYVSVIIPMIIIIIIIIIIITYVLNGSKVGRQFPENFSKTLDGQERNREPKTRWNK